MMKKTAKDFRPFNIEQNVLDLWRIGLRGEHLKRALLRRAEEMSDWIATPGKGNVVVHYKDDGRIEIDMGGWCWAMPDWAKAKIFPASKAPPTKAPAASTKAFCEKCGELMPVRLVAKDIPLLLPITQDELTHMCLYECVMCQSWMLMPGEVAGEKIGSAEPCSRKNRAEAEARQRSWWNPPRSEAEAKQQIPEHIFSIPATREMQRNLTKAQLAEARRRSNSFWIGSEGWTSDNGLAYCPSGHDTIAYYTIPNPNPEVAGVLVNTCLTCEEKRFRSGRIKDGFRLEVRGHEPEEKPKVDTRYWVGNEFAWMMDGTIRCLNNHMWVFYERGKAEESWSCVTCGVEKRRALGRLNEGGEVSRLLFVGKGRKLDLTWNNALSGMGKHVR